jgi:hypothetical protein
LPEQTLAALLPADELPAAAAKPLPGRTGGRAEPPLRIATVGTPELELEEQRRLVAAFPHLLILLEHPQLQLCGSCDGCAAQRRRGRSASRARQRCLLRARFKRHYQRQQQQEEQQQRGQRQRQRQPRKWQHQEQLEASEGEGGIDGGGHGSGDLSHATVLAGVPEGDALRAAAAYKLLHPKWHPAFLAPARLQAVDAALPAAAAALQRNGTGELQGAAGAGAAPRAVPPQYLEMQRLLKLLRAGATAQEQQLQEAQRDAQPQQHERLAVLDWSARSAFRPVPPGQHQPAPAAAGQPTLTGQQLRQQLSQLPQDVQLAFRAGLAAGLPPAAVAAALQRYHSITSIPAAAAPTASSSRAAAAPGSSGGSRRKRAVKRRHDSSAAADIGSGDSGIEEDGGEADYESSSSDEPDHWALQQEAEEEAEEQVGQEQEETPLGTGKGRRQR